jgi:hypothetical protein
LDGRAFTVAEAVAAGVSVDRLRARDLDRALWGVRMPRGASLLERCRAALLVAPRGAFICGPTAAALHGMPIPTRFREHIRIDLAVPAPGRAVRRAGVAGRCLRITATDVVERSGIRLSSPARTWCDLAPHCSVPELVAAADWAVRGRLVDVERLRAAISAHPDHRQRAKLHAAAELVDASAESPKESELRALVALAGLPAVEGNVEVFDGRGRFVARVDLLFRAYGEVLEYHGDHHRTDLRQWRHDRTREAELESLGLHVMEVTNADLATPRLLVARIARNLQRRGWRGELAVSRWFPAG